MKKAIASLLCALILLGLAPLYTPEAQAVTSAYVYTSDTSIYVGDTVRWHIDDEVGSGYYSYAFDIYKDNKLYSYQSSYDNYWYRYFTPTAPGKYKVKAWVYDEVYDNYISWFSNVVNVYTRPVNKITKVEPASATSLKITWTKMPGATKYELYRATKKAGPYTLIRTTTGTAFSNTYLKAGTPYFYKVRFYTEDEGWSTYSPVAAGVPMAKSAITRITSPSRGKVTLTWGKAVGASGYQVLMSTSANGTYKSVRILAGNTTTFTGLKAGSTMFFKVKPYKKLYSTTYWGALSAYKAIKVK